MSTDFNQTTIIILFMFQYLPINNQKQHYRTYLTLNVILLFQTFVYILENLYV